MRKCFRDPLNSSSFDSVTHGLGLGMLDAALDVIVAVLEQQIRVLSGAAASDQADSAPSARRARRRQRRGSPGEGERSRRVPGGEGEQADGAARLKGRSKSRKRALQEAAAGPLEPRGDGEQDRNVLTLVSLGYETVSGGLNATGAV